MNQPSKLIRGKCYCGKIQFTLATPTKMFSHCHCESCRRSHGAAFVSWTSVLNEQFDITEGRDWLNGYESSPGIVWQFCRHCGSPLFQTTRHSPTITYVVAAALLDPLDRLADGHFSYEERVNWLEIADTLPKYVAKTSDVINS